MKPELESPGLWTKMVAGAALGAAAMFVFDPVRGRRRRAIARDKAYSFVCDARDLVSTAARDIRYRAQGVQAEARRRLHREPVTDDLVLIERVRAKLGRVVSHPHAIQVGAEHGRVSRSGPILESEVLPLLQAVRGVPGVTDIEEHLVAHRTPGTVPSLQGGSRRIDTDWHAGRQNWTPTLCAAAMIGGALLALYGLRHKSIAGTTLVGIGIGSIITAGTRRPRSRHSPRISSPRRSSDRT